MVTREVVTSITFAKNEKDQTNSLGMNPVPIVQHYLVRLGPLEARKSRERYIFDIMPP